MADIKLSIKESAGDDHEIHVKLKIEGNRNEVKKWLKNYV